MNAVHCLAALALAAASTLGLAGSGHADDTQGPAAPVYGVQLPAKYRDWPLVAPAQEAAPLDELRVVVANPIALRAYREHTLPFPDGSVLVKRAWKHTASPDFATASIPGAATTVQVMVKDSRKYAATGGWGYGRFVDGRPVDEAQHRSCHACHAARVKDRDYVFTHYAP